MGIDPVFSNGFWMTFWKFYLAPNFIIMPGIVVWLLIGGTIDIRKMFKALSTVKKNDADDGTVVGHHSLADEEILGDKLDDEN